MLIYLYCYILYFLLFVSHSSNTWNQKQSVLPGTTHVTSCQLLFDSNPTACSQYQNHEQPHIHPGKGASRKSCARVRMFRSAWYVPKASALHKVCVLLQPIRQYSCASSRGSATKPPSGVMAVTSLTKNRPKKMRSIRKGRQYSGWLRHAGSG